MGKKKETKTVLSVIEGSIYDIENRIAILKEKGDPVTGKQSNKVKQELATLTKQLEYARTAKKVIEEQLQRIKKEEERKALENILKYAMLVGVITENIRIREVREYDSPLWVKRIFFHSAEDPEDIFENEEFRFVTREDVDDILADKTLQQMAAEDPGRLEREEEDMRAEYERMMEKAFLLSSEKLPDGDFAEHEKRFKNFLKKTNGFEEALRRTRPFVTRDLPAIGSEEDIRFFDEVLKEAEELGKITRQLQEEFLIGDSSFEKGNGYTKELVDREKRLVKKIEDFGDKKVHGENGLLTMDPDSQEARCAVRVYERSQMMLTSIRQQAERDEVLQRNNDFREKMERWRVYRRYSRGIEKITVTEDQRRKAWAKLQRMEKAAVMTDLTPDAELSEAELEERRAALREGRFGIQEDTSFWAMEEMQSLLKQLDSVHNPVQQEKTQVDMKEVREKIAALVLQQIISDEMKRPLDEPRPYYDEIKNLFFKSKFLEMAKELAGTKEFKAALKPYIRSKSISEDCIRFLAKDQEKPIARKLGGLKRKLEPKPARTANRGH